jgi:hypothetical protein
MSWAEKMKAHADVSTRDHHSTDANIMRSTTPTSWDPHEVWVTRVKQPRERLARRATTSAGSQVLELPD